MVYRCGFSSGHQTSSSSFIPGWLVLLLQVKTQQTFTEFCTWDIVFATTAPSFTSTFASTLYQVQYCLRSWWIQTSNRREVTWTCVRCPTKYNRCWEVWVIFISFPPNHGYVVWLPNIWLQWTRSWWKVFSFGCTIWVEKPAKLFYCCVDFWSIQHANKTFQLRACIRGQIIVIS